MRPNPWILFAIAKFPTACHCESESDVDTEPMATDSEVSSTSTSGASGVLTGSSGEESTGAPFDASRWIGRYHYEYVFAEWGDPEYTDRLVNFVIFEDSTATMLFDYCAYDSPELIHYEWTPDEPGWIELHPGAGEPYLRFLIDQPYETIRVHLIEPCRELEIEVDGNVASFTPFYPGASCWINRCGDGMSPVIDYCEGEEPPPCP